MKKIKIAITGAAGQIAYALLFRIISGDMFGSETSIDLHLLEIEPMLSKLEGLKMELEDCASPFLNQIICTTDENEAMRDVNWAILVGAAPRKAGMERADLLKKNGEIFVKQGRALGQNAANDVRVLVVGNPCNTNCLITMNQATEIPNDRFFALTKLDENRAKALLTNKTQTSIRDISNMIIWGNHSATQYPDFYHAMLQDKPVTEIVKDETWLQTDFISQVQQRGAAIIQARGASSAASAANAVVDCIRDLTRQSASDIDHPFSVAKCSTGEYDIDEGLIFSVPCFIKNGVLNVVEGIEHNPWAQQKITTTLDELRQEKKMAETLKLL